MRDVQDKLRGSSEADAFFPPGALPALSVAEGNAGVEGPALQAPLEQGRRIGGYRIVSLLGRGGMGLVYTAEQQHPKRIVALKVIHPGLASPQHVRRFMREADALGRLQHPGIAQIYESGTDDAGCGPQPFFAMELIRGDSITAFASSRSLPPKARLELFAKICDAVDYAHQHGVVHRDLKPANILVDDTGQPKILDFGVARITDGDLPGVTQHTEVGQLIGTLAYMSPEQAGGASEQIDRRSDVYTLGVILYELLTGKMPYRLSNTALPDAIRAIRDDDPTRLSSINRSFGGDIETIVNKALEKHKDRRYQTAAEFIADIRHFLANEPILARPPSTMYQLHKFARRHRALVIGVIAVFLALVLGLIGTSWEAIRATHQQLVAEHNEQQAIAERKRADAEKDRANKEAHEAQLRLAQSLVSQGDALLAANRVPDARRIYLAAWDAFDRIGVSSLAAELGVWDTDRLQPQPICTIETGSTDSLNAALFIDDYRVVSAQGPTIQIWDARTRQPLAVLEGHKDSVSSLDISRDGRLILSGSMDRSLKIWDASNGKLLRSIDDPGGRIDAVAFAPDGKMILSAGSDRRLRLWDAANGKLIRNFAPTRQGIYSIAFSPNGSEAISAGGAGEMKLWDIQTGTELRSYVGHTGEVRSIAFSSRGDQAVSGGADRTVHIWDVASGRQVHMFSLSAAVSSIRFSSEGDSILCGTTDGAVGLYRVASEQVQQFVGLGTSVSTMAWSPGGTLFLAGDISGHIAIWNADETHPHEIAAHRGIVLSVATDPNGRITASAGVDGKINIWDVATCCLVKSLGGSDRSVSSITISSDGERIAAAGEDRIVRVWDIYSGDQLHTFSGHTGAINCVRFSSDNQQLFSAGEDGTVRRWDLSDVETNVLLQKSGAVYTIATKRDRSALFCGTDGGIYGIGTAPIKINMTDLNAMELSPDGTTLASGGSDGAIKLWDATNGESKGVMRGHTAEVRALAFSPAGGAIFSVGGDQMIRVWNLAEANEMRAISAGRSVVFCLGICQDERTLISGGDDGKLRIWDFASQRDDRVNQAVVQHAYETLSKTTRDGNCLAVLGDWYAHHGANQWAAPLLEDARKQRVAISSLTLARCYWQLQQYDASIKEFDRALENHEASESYLILCRKGVEATEQAAHADVR